MKYCSNCGQPLREGVKVCTNCGKPVQQSKPNHSNTRKIITTKVDKISMSNINIKGIITIIKTVMPTDMINNHVKAIIKDLDYYCSYILLIALIVAFSVLKINFLRKSKHLILHKQLRKMTKSISQRSYNSK